MYLGRSDEPFERREGGIEPLDVADLEQGDARARASLTSSSASASVEASGFSTMRRDPARQEGAGHRAVQGRRDGDRDGVDAIDQVAVIGERLGAVAPGDGRGLLDPGVGHADQLDVGDRGEDPGVVLAEVTDADHGDAQVTPSTGRFGGDGSGLSHAGAPRRARCGRSCSRG